MWEGGYYENTKRGTDYCHDKSCDRIYLSKKMTGNCNYLVSPMLVISRDCSFI